jgi:hypothetical protein
MPLNYGNSKASAGYVTGSCAETKASLDAKGQAD